MSMSDIADIKADVDAHLWLFDRYRMIHVYFVLFSGLIIYELFLSLTEII
jgi:hypothetical protein